MAVRKDAKIGIASSLVIMFSQILFNLLEWNGSITNSFFVVVAIFDDRFTLKES